MDLHVFDGIHHVRHTLKRASNAMVRPPSIHLIDVKITPEGEVETVLPVMPDEEMEFKEFYSAILQTLLHPLGKVDGMKFNPLELVGHLQRIFHVPNASHSTLVKEEVNKRPDHFFLRVTVVEAKDIKGMDPNGMSDPYCILTHCNKASSSCPSQQRSSPQHSHNKNQARSDSLDQLTSHKTHSLQHANTLPQTSGNSSSKFLSPQTSVPETSHHHSLSRNIQRNRSFNRKDRRRKSLEHLGVDARQQNIQQDLHVHSLAVPDERRRKGSDSFPISPNLTHNNSLEANSLYRTSCKSATLHPVWNETFDIELDRLDGELIITMWDLDEETSLWDACKSLEAEHKLAGIKNIFRHMKHGINKCTDDFLGQITIPLDKIEAATITEDWYRLQRGHAKVMSSQVTGKLHLKMHYLRIKSENHPERDERALSYYHQLVTAAQKHDAGKHIKSRQDKEKTPWDGRLSRLSHHVLNQFAVQNGISKLSQNIMYLSALLDFQLEFTRKLKEIEMAPPELIMEPLPEESAFDETDSSPPLSSLTPNNNNQGNNSSLTGSLSEKMDPPKDDKTVRRSPNRSSLRRQGSEFDYGEKFVPQQMVNGKLGGLVINDRFVREALYKIHAEMMAESAVTIYGSDPKGLATLFENRPEWLRFETAIVENSISSYIYECLANLPDCEPFFPPTNLIGLDNANKNCKLQLLQNLLSMSIWRDHDTPVHRLVMKLLESVVRNDTRKYILTDLDAIPLSQGSLKPGELVDLLARYAELLSRFTIYCKNQKDYKNFFSRFHVDFFSTVTIEIDRQVSKYLQDIILIRLNQYHARYRRFPQNIAEASKAGLALYMAVKNLVSILKKNVTGNERLQLEQYSIWFQVPLTYWLVTFQHETFSRVHKALELDKDVKLVHEVVKYSNSAVDVQACFAKVTQEWQSIGYECPNSRCMAITKLTDLICEGAKLYACKIHCILESNGFYKTSKDGQFDIKDKLCITLNNIEHVRGYLDNLPTLLEWEANCNQLAAHHQTAEAGKLTLSTLRRLTQRACHDIHYMSSLLEKKIAYRLSQEVNKHLDKFVNPQKGQTSEECMEELLDYIDENLGTLYKQLLPQIFPRLVQELWNALLTSIRSRIQDGRPPGYYKRLQQSLDSLEAYFQRPGIELTSSTTRTDEYHAIMEKLEPNTRSTFSLLALYYRDLALDMATPMAYLGHVSIKMAYHEVPGDMRSLSVKVCNAVDLPGVKRNGFSDPKIIVEIAPETTFNKVLSFKTMVKYKELNPVYNQVFQFGALPEEAFELDTVILSVTVVDHNSVVCDSFIGEAFIPLHQARQVTEKQTVDHCPAIMLALKRPRRLRGHVEILRSRSKWDKSAKQFITKRTWAIQQQRQRTDKKIVKRHSHNAFFPE
ncbi:BAI1-associated protein 3-like isoform X1 [Lytechinus pictus]|uniref:BAI1-associated protein 3-like isoform X1 n=2 Tax=Lytechinus pictus TaxID=7653 RepID=UPI0030B9E67E